jgi:hypothetical protein
MSILGSIGRAGETIGKALPTLSRDSRIATRVAKGARASDKFFSAVGKPGLRSLDTSFAKNAEYAVKRGRRRVLGAAVGGAAMYGMAAPPNPNSRRGIAAAGGRFKGGTPYTGGMSSGGSGMLSSRSSGGFA